MIILAVATVAVLYAGYELLIAGPSAKKAARATAPVEEKAVLSALASDIMSNKATAADIYVVVPEKVIFPKEHERGSF